MYLESLEEFVRNTDLCSLDRDDTNPALGCLRTAAGSRRELRIRVGEEGAHRGPGLLEGPSLGVQDRQLSVGLGKGERWRIVGRSVS